MTAIDPRKMRVATTVADRKRMAEKYADEGVTFRPKERRDRLKELEHSFDVTGIAGVKSKRKGGGLVDLGSILGTKPKHKSHGKAYNIGTSLNPESTSSSRKKGKGGLSKLR